jgi:uncharacterized protein YjbI with pentapeptide repeats
MPVTANTSRRPRTSGARFAAAIGMAVAAVVARADGSGWGPATALALLLGLGIYIWMTDEAKSWGDLGQGIVVGVFVAIALLAVQHDADTRIRAATQHQDRRSERQNLQLTLSSQHDLRDISLAHRDLRGFFLSRKNLEGADLRGARLDNAALFMLNLKNADAIGVRFDGAGLFGSDISDTTFSDFSSPDPEEATYRTPASFRRSNLEQVNAHDIMAGGVDFTDATLTESNMRKAWLSRAHFRRALLIATDLTNAVLDNADLRGAKLGGARLCGATLSSVKLNGAEYDAYTRWPKGFEPTKYGARRSSRANVVKDDQWGVESDTTHLPPC